MGNKAGTLYIVSTPIGNLGDITIRALEVLKEVDAIISEDTRETTKLINKYSINKPQLVYNDSNHPAALIKIKELLTNGKNLALVSDAGTPLVSDPGFKLVRDLKEAGFNITAVPGAVAATTALILSGLPSDKFVFLGFLPKKAGPATQILKEFGSTSATLIIYESPYRISELLLLTQQVLGNRQAAIVREMTKLYEEVLTGTLESLSLKIEQKPLKGELVLVISKDL